MAERYNTNNPRPSNSMKDINDNALAYDDFINSDADDAVDRFNKPFPTVRKQVAIRIDELVGASQNAIKSAEIAKEAASNAQNIADANTYPITDTDPDGTIAGLAGTPLGSFFRVAQGVISENAFIYYLNKDGMAVPIASLPGSASVEVVNAKVLSYFMHISLALFNDFDITTESIDHNDSGVAYHYSLDSEFISGIMVGRFILSVGTTSPVKLEIKDGVDELFSFTILPGESLISGEYFNRYNKFKISNGRFQSAVIGPRVSRARFNMNWSAIGGLPTQNDDTVNIYDRTLRLAASSAGNADTVLVDSVSYSTATGGFQIVVLNSNVTGAGYALNETGIRAYIDARYHSLTLESLKPNGVQLLDSKYPHIFFTQDGQLTIITSRGCTLTGEVRQRKRVTSSTTKKIVDTAHTRISCDVENFLSHPMENELIKIAVNFEPGEVPAQECITVSDFDGNLLGSVQFMEEWDVNSRKRQSHGYHADGSLRSGYVCIRDSLPVGGNKTYVLRCYQDARINTAQYKLVKIPTGYSLTVGAYTYDFAISAAYQLVSALKGTETSRLAVSCYVAHATAAPSYSEVQVSKDNSSIRLINSGPLYCEVEVVNFNGSLNNLPSGSVRMTTRYKFFINGEIRIDCVTDVVSTLIDGALLGAYTRIDFGASSPTIGSTYFNALWTTALGTKQSASLLYANGDLHRSGTNYGPRRPEHVLMAVATGTGALRAQGGWRYNMIPAQAPAPEPGWAWTAGFLIKLDDYNTDTTALAARSHNGLIGFAGNGIHQYVQQQRLMNRIAEFCLGYSQFWNNDATTEDTGGGISNCLAADLVNLCQYGIGSFEAIYNAFDAFCKKNYIGITSLGQAYTSKKLPLQYASRVLAQPLWWIYMHAVSVGDTDKIDKLKTGITGLADALLATFLNNGGVPLVFDTTSIGGSNSNGTAYRFMCMSVAVGHDPAGAMSAGLDGMDELFKAKFLAVENILTDGAGERLNMRYLHYQAFAYNNYLIGCSTAGRAPFINMTNYLMNSVSAYGAAKDVEYCISESRRGDINTSQFCLYSHLFQGGLSGVHFAEAIMDNLDEALGPIPGKPRRLWDFTENVTIADPRLPIGFALNIFADVWFENYYRMRG